MPLKGGHLAFNVYSHPDDRPMSDIDILVDGTCFREAVDALELAGWRSIGDLGQRFFGYVLEEGYNWPVVRDRIGIEVHFRLWGRVPEAMAPALFETADRWLDLGDTALRPGLAEAFVVAAIHAWKSPRPDHSLPGGIFGRSSKQRKTTWLAVLRSSPFGGTCRCLWGLRQRRPTRCGPTQPFLSWPVNSLLMRACRRGPSGR
jgi:hypothetical protein